MSVYRPFRLFDSGMIRLGISLLFGLICCVPGTYAQVSAVILSSDTTGCGSQLVTFNGNLSTGANLTYEWTFGNGNFGDGAIVLANYTLPGTYQVALVVTDTIGLSADTAFTTIIVHPNPSAGFTGSPGSGCAPLAVTFAYQGNTQGTPIQSYSWDFGDGTVVTGANPIHSYLTPGSFDVTLLVVDTNGCQGLLTQPDLITVSTPPEVSLNLSLPTNCVLPFNVGFQANATGTGPFTYQWDFGDGNTGQGMSPSHAYQAAGTYTVELTLTDGAGCSRLFTFPDTVKLDFPQANFGILDTQVCVGENLTIFDLSTGASSYAWNFGAGSVVTGPNPTFAYLDTGVYTVTLVATNDAGCDDTLTRMAYVEVLPSPQSDFLSSDPTGCEAPFLVDFTQTSMGGVDYQWNFGDSTAGSTLANPTHSYQDTGSFDITLITTNLQGCTDTVTLANYVRIIPPIAGIDAAPVDGCAPLAVTFNDISTSPLDPIVGWNWNFGGLGVATTPNSSFSFGAGQYNVRLQVTTAAGCVDTVEELIQVGTLPIVNFDAAPQIVCANQEVAFLNQSTNVNAQTEWQWFFGDGAGSNAENPLHAYNDTGTFDAMLIASNFGCMDTLIIPDFIRVLPPVAEFIMNPAQGCTAPLAVSFADVSIAPDSWIWSFGDGDSSNLQNPVHVYTSPGTYPVSLVVTNATTGCTDVFQQDLTISNPEAAFTAQSTTSCANTDLSFVNNSTAATNYLWLFGDGDSSTVVNPSHQYDVPGNYTVTLIAIDGNGCQDTVIQPNVSQIVGPQANFGADTTDGCAPFVVTFSDSSSSTSTILSWIWDFGDGNFSGVPNPTHQYISPGAYDVSLVVIDQSGCADTLERVSYIRPTQPMADFDVVSPLACTGQPVLFQQQSTGNLVSYDWQFGDGTSSAVPNPIKTYPNNGLYTVTLTVADINGCQSTISQTNLLDIGPPTADFDANPIIATCPPHQVNFTDQSSPDVTQWFWQFGDGSTSGAINPAKIYNLPGSYDVSLIVESVPGCRDTLVRPGLIDLSGPSGTFTMDVLNGCTPLSVAFQAQTQGAVQWVWDFGDGQGATGDSSVVHTYLSDTIATPSLVITDAAGCSRTITIDDSVVIRPGPEPNFTATRTEACPGEVISFTNQTTTLSTLNFTWRFGDPDSSSTVGTGASFAYDAPGTYEVTLIAQAQNGCVDSITKPVIVQTPPTAAFSPDDDSVCLGAPITFNDNTTAGDDPLVAWEWRFEPGQTSTLQSPTYTFGSTGTQTVQLIAIDDHGCRDTTQGSVLIHSLPTADFEAPDTTGCAPKSVLFPNLSTGLGPNASYFWDFGDGDTSTIESPVHTYLQDGSFDVLLVVTTQYGCRDSLLQPDLIALSRPNADFVSDANPSCPPLAVSFNATATADTNIVLYAWDFGNGDVDSVANPQYQYTNSGTYAVQLVVEDLFGCRDTLLDTQHVVVYTPPQVDFELSTLEFCAPGNVVVTDSSQAGDAPLISRLWDFGNGVNAIGSSATAPYNAGGSYAICLSVTDANGCADTICENVLVHPEAVADFTVDDSTGCRNVAVTFLDQSNPSPPVVSWTWAFGDGDSAFVSSPTHTYDSNGSYDVTLLVEDQNGCQDSITKPGLINLDGPSADFTPLVQSLCPGTSASFTDASTGPAAIVRWWWDFGNGDTSDQQNPSYLYSQPGWYTVQLTIEDGNGCLDTLSRTDAVEVYPRPVANFGLSDSVGCAPLTVTCWDSSSSPNGPVVGYLYDFANGSGSVVPNPTRTFLTPGVFDIQLTITDNLGCQDTMLRTLIAQDTPVANLSVDLQYVCPLQQITFTSQSTGVGVDGQLYWDFGDGSPLDSGIQVFHSYANDGSYDITLVAVNEQGCTDTLRLPQLIEIGPPQVDFTVSDTTACPGTTLTFSDATQADIPLVSWSWDFGDGNGDTVALASHAYASSGTYDVSLTVVDSLGCTGSLIRPTLIEIWTPPVASMVQDTNIGCPPLTVQFADQSILTGATLASRNWTFGNGVSSNNSTYTTTYAQAGSLFTPQLVIEDSHGCRDTTEGSVQTHTLPGAQFFAPTSPGCVGAPVQLTDFSGPAGTIADWIWDFGDGSGQSGIANPAHAYDSAGVYAIRLQVIDLNGCQDSADVASVIQIWQPQAAFSSDAPGCPGEPITFSDQSSADTTLVSWVWDFGTGVSALGASVTHIYPGPGLYDLTLMVEDANGCRDTLSAPQAIEIFMPPVAAMDLTPDSGCVPLLVMAEDQSTGPAPITNQLWSLNGQVISSGLQVNFGTLPVGWHHITLEVTDGNSCRDTLMDSVLVHDLPQVSFAADDSQACAGQAIRFTGSATPDGVDWQWRFGDGQLDSVAQPLHVYDQDGQYDVTLVVTDINGCTDSLTKPRYIRLERPDATFTFTDPVDCPPVEVGFFASISGNHGPFMLDWSFGDTWVASGGDSIYHTYEAPGSFDVELTVVDTQGCELIITDTLLIDSEVQPASVDVYAATVDNGEQVTLTWAASSLANFDSYRVYWQNDLGNWEELARNWANTTYAHGDPIRVQAEARPQCYRITQVNTCQVESSLEEAETHCTVEVEATALDDRMSIQWEPYQGWDMVSSYTLYRVEGYAGQRIELATVPGFVTQFTDSTTSCFNAYAYRIEAQGEAIEEVAWSDTTFAENIKTAPTQTTYLARATVEDNLLILVEWTPWTEPDLSEVLLERSTDLGMTWTPLATFSPDTLSFRDDAVDVQSQPYYYRLLARDSCGFTTPYSNQGTSIHLEVSADGFNNRLTWTPYTGWTGGVDRYEVEILNPQTGRWEPIHVATPDQTGFLHPIQAANQLVQGQYCYRVVAYERGGPKPGVYPIKVAQESTLSFIPQTPSRRMEMASMMSSS